MTEDQYQRLLTELAQMRRHTEETNEATRRRTEETNEATRRHTEETNEATRRHVEETSEAMRRHMEETSEATRRHFDVVAEDLRGRIVLLAEGLGSLGERLDAEREERRRERAADMAEIKALFRVSYAGLTDLDRRVTRLEGLIQ